MKPTGAEKGTFSCPFWCPFSNCAGLDASVLLCGGSVPARRTPMLRCPARRLERQAQVRMRVRSSIGCEVEVGRKSSLLRVPEYASRAHEGGGRRPTIGNALPKLGEIDVIAVRARLRVAEKGNRR